VLTLHYTKAVRHVLAHWAAGLCRAFKGKLLVAGGLPVSCVNLSVSAWCQGQVLHSMATNPKPCSDIPACWEGGAVQAMAPAPAQGSMGHLPHFSTAAEPQTPGACSLCCGSRFGNRRAAAQVWYHAQFEGISPGHLADMLAWSACYDARNVANLLALMELRRAGSRESPTVSWQAVLQKGALGFWRHGSIWWLGAPSGPQSSLTAFARWCCISHVSLLHPDRRFACRNQRSCLGASVPWQKGSCTAQATSILKGPFLQSDGSIEMPHVVHLHVCPSFHQLQTLLCAALSSYCLGSPPCCM
jgi:hypothetical protein